MGLVENAAKRADWDFALFGDDGGVDNIVYAAYKFDVTAPLT